MERVESDWYNAGIPPAFMFFSFDLSLRLEKMLDQIFVIVGITVLIMISPGPDMVIVMKKYVRGRKACRPRDVSRNIDG